MAHPYSFASLRLPKPRKGAIVCAGLSLEGDAGEWVEAAAAFATPLERAHAGRFQRAQDAALHLAGRALARRMLGQRPDRPLAGEFVLAPWGKPLLPPGSETEPAGPDFSIAHSGGMVWVAVCHEAPVGIDVERSAPLADAWELAAQLHPRECAEIRSRTGPECAASFLRCWTRKEAVLKALGRGLSLALCAFQVRTDPCGSDWLVAPPREGGCEAWTTRDIEAGPGHQCSVAAGAGGLPLEIFLS